MPTRRRKLNVAALVASFLLGATAASGFFLLTDLGNQEDVVGPGGTQTQGSGGIEVSALLLDHIPEAIRPTCSETTNPDPGAFLVTVSCALQNGIEVEYSLSHSGTTMTAHYLEERSAHAIDAGGGNCAFVERGESEWWRVGSQGHLTLDPGEGPGPRGRAFCYEEQDGSAIVWIDRSLKIFATATIAPADHATLFQWWADQAGPANPEVLSHADTSPGMEMGDSEGSTSSTGSG